MADVFSEFIEAVKGPLAEFASKQFSDLRAQAQSDIQSFLAQCRVDLERWTALVAAGQITTDEFRSLLKGEQSLGQLHALKQAGLVQARWDMFVNGVIDILVKGAFSVLV